MKEWKLSTSRGEDATLTCTAVGDLPFSIHWVRNGENYPGGRTSQIRNGLKSSLIIKKVNTDDTGEYKCISKSEHGGDEAIILLTVNGKSQRVRSLALLS